MSFGPESEADGRLVKDLNQLEKDHGMEFWFLSSNDTTPEKVAAHIQSLHWRNLVVIVVRSEIQNFFTVRCHLEEDDEEDREVID